MDPDVKVVLVFVIVLASWLLLPIVPAWLTTKITPDQNLGLKGPLQGLTLRATGAFVSYFAVLLTIAFFVASVGFAIMGPAMSDPTWTITGRIKLENAEGADASPPTNLDKFTVRVAPNTNVVDRYNISLRLPIPETRRPVVYVDIPDWGGGRISLADTDSYEENKLERTIKMRGVVILREQPRERSTLGPPLPTN